MIDFSSALQTPILCHPRELRQDVGTPGTIMEEGDLCHDSDEDSGRGGSVQLVPGPPDQLLRADGYLCGPGSSGSMHRSLKGSLGRHQQLELTPRVGGNYVTAPKKLKGMSNACHVIYEGRQSTSSMV